jgi:hypothetical protein
MFDKILFARIGWGEAYRGEELAGNFREPNESGSWWERFNFKASVNGLCYGYVPPMGYYHTPPRPTNHHGWLVIFVATEDGRLDGALLPVGWYEEATIENDYKKRPEKDLDQSYEYILTTGTKSAYLIPKEKRSSFPTIPTEHFKRCFVYARSPVHREHWRIAYADLAERISRPQTPR